MIYRILDTANGRPYTVRADSPDDAVLTLCRTHDVRTFNTAILESGDRPKGDPLATDRTLHPGEVVRGLTPAERELVGKPLDEMPASFDRECAAHDASFTAEVLAGAR